MIRGRSVRVLLLAGAATLAITTVAYAHTALRASTPAEDEILETAPTEITLSYTTSIDPRLANVQLLRADGSAVQLDSLRTGANDSVLVAGIAESLASGKYTVSWQVIGTDGHPVRGRFAFTVAASAAAPPPEPQPVVADPEPVPPVDPSTIGEPEASVESPPFVAVRWLTFATLVVVIGAVVFRTLVLEPVRRASRMPSGGAADQAASRAAVLGRGAAGFLILAAGARLLLQSRAVAVPGEGNGVMRVMLFDTVWGWGWFLQVVAALLALVAFHRAMRAPGRGWGAAVVAAFLLAFTPALSGHAAAAEGVAPVAVALDGVHVLAASAWLGTLLVTLVAGVPSALAQGGSGGKSMVFDLINRFSPLALTFAAVLAATGVGTAIIHLDSLAQLWGTDYGRTLLVKLAIVVAVIATGAYNWRRVRPTLAEAGPGRLRRSATIELAGAAAVLLVTAILVATPTP